MIVITSLSDHSFCSFCEVLYTSVQLHRWLHAQCSVALISLSC